MGSSKERNIRVVGHRRAFEVGRFVLAVMALAESQAAEAKSAEPDASVLALPAVTGPEAKGGSDAEVSDEGRAA